MLQIQSFTFNPFQENTYLLYNEEQKCWIIDPGMYGAAETQVLLDFITLHQLQPQQIINTHAHIDHILGINALKQIYDIPFGVHQLEQPLLNNAMGSAMMFGLQLGVAPRADFFIKEGSDLLLGEEKLELRLAPGHSPGSIIFYYPKGEWAISGDVLFQGSIGRTDLPGGHHDTLLQSIREQVYTLPDNTRIYAGHGGLTTVGIEKRSNPFIQA